ncbi:MAG: peptidylprolyl isomerase [Bacteroidales bacterium]|jgi:peptidylprolyl isomerase
MLKLKSRILKQFIFIMVIFLGINACKSQQKGDVIIHTDYGDIVVELYDDTPLHKENFLKLVEEGFYDSLLFHRVISNFMIQGGDPESKNAKEGAMLGSGGPGYTIPAEINPHHIHKKGALSAARQGDQVNPEKRSSGSQFYIVQGQKYNDSQIKQFDQRRADLKMQTLFNEFLQDSANADYLNRLQEAYLAQDQKKYNSVIEEIYPELEEKLNEDTSWKLTEEQKEIYKTIGGTPHLDNDYTVFGEVIEGLEVIDKIAAVRTDKNDRPYEDVKMWAEVIKK